MYTTDHILPVLPIKKLVYQDSEPNMLHKLATGIKPSVSNLRVVLCPCVLQKSAALIDKKELNMHHQSQKQICGIFVGIPQYQKVCLVYIPSTKKNLRMTLYFMKHFILR